MFWNERWITELPAICDQHTYFYTKKVQVVPPVNLKSQGTGHTECPTFSQNDIHAIEEVSIPDRDDSRVNPQRKDQQEREGDTRNWPKGIRSILVLVLKLASFVEK